MFQRISGLTSAFMCILGCGVTNIGHARLKNDHRITNNWILDIKRYYFFFQKGFCKSLYLVLIFSSQVSLYVFICQFTVIKSLVINITPMRTQSNTYDAGPTQGPKAMLGCSTLLYFQALVATLTMHGKIVRAVQWPFLNAMNYRVPLGRIHRYVCPQFVEQDYRANEKARVRLSLSRDITCFI